MSDAFMECEIYVRKRKKYIMSLDGGIEAGIKFAKLADAGIIGSIKTWKGWYCNRDVTIKGKYLLEFIRTNYPNRYQQGLSEINKKSTYVIVSYDLS